MRREKEKKKLEAADWDVVVAAAAAADQSCQLFPSFSSVVVHLFSPVCSRSFSAAAAAVAAAGMSFCCCRCYFCGWESCGWSSY